MYTIQTLKNVIGYTDNMKNKQTNNKGDYNMSKTKQWAEDTAEKSVDLILKKLKDGQIDLDTATTDILSVENVKMTGINADNVGEVISENA
jgi:hypothetical protein